jgi:hypothetical protein
MNLDTAIATEEGLRAISDVAGYITWRNADTNARAAAEGWTFWTVLPTDPTWVARFASAYDLELYYAQAGWFETYRDVRGYKPRGGSPSTLEDCRKAVDALFAEADADARWEAEEADRVTAEAARVAAVTAEAMEGTPLTHNPFAGLLG